ncbi:MAG: hypothetical protein ACRYFX_14715 [Janthinobacterium lividum]
MRRFVHRKLILRLRVFALVFMGMVSAVGYRVMSFYTHLLPVLESVVLGHLAELHVVTFE